MNKPQTGGKSTGQVSKEASSVLQRYEPVIGLEVHVQLQTATKLFCGCAVRYGASPNEKTCPVCLGYPGALPVLNRKAVDHAILLSVAVGSKIASRSIFARKQYFYPDLPKGYQISQFEHPYSLGGFIAISGDRKIPLTRLHLEEDAGKNIHEGRFSYVDLNRAGTPLVEVVSEPAIHSVADAINYLQELHALVRHLGVCDGNMEEGSFRCDVNVSLRPRGSKTLGTRVEVKNVNSFRNIEKALVYEILRQADFLDSGQPLVQETRLFDAALAKTTSMRTKEEAHDYRYFPDPDLPILEISEARINELKIKMPELPQAKYDRYRHTLGLSQDDARQLAQDPELARYFEQTLAHASELVSPKLIANWIITELLSAANRFAWRYGQIPLPSSDFASLLGLIASEKITGKIAKQVFEQMVTTGGAPDAIVAAQNLGQILDESVIASVVDEVLSGAAKQVAEYKAGKVKVFGYFVGQVMGRSQGKFNPDVVNRLIKERLK